MKNSIMKVTMAAVLLLYMCSCNVPKDELPAKYNTTDLADGSYALLYEEKVIYPYDGKLYAATAVDTSPPDESAPDESGSGVSQIGFYDMSNNMAYTRISDRSADALWVDEGGIYVLSAGKLLIISEGDGSDVSTCTVTNEVALDMECREWTDYYLFATEEYFFVTEVIDTMDVEENFIHQIDRKSGAVQKKELKAEYVLRHVYSMGEKSSGVLHLVCQYKNELGYFQNGLFEYSVSGGGLRFVTKLKGG